jgi:hypothetical protein
METDDQFPCLQEFASGSRGPTELTEYSPHPYTASLM